MKILAIIIYILLPTAIVFVLLFGTVFSLKIWQKKMQWGKRSPLRDYKLWRNPGESLREKIEDASFSMMADLAIIPIMFLVFTPFYFSHFLAWQKGGGNPANLLITILINISFIVFCIWRIIKAWSKKHNLQLGLDGEIYVGQQLNHLMLLGCRVYHDFQTEKLGNIDHIVVSPVGVFVVETKGNYKPDKNRGKTDYTVAFDGQYLHFSDIFQTDKPLKQAQKNAANFSKWLSSAIGRDINAIPVVALPGWWIDYKTYPKNGKIYNGKLENNKGQFDTSKMKESFFVKQVKSEPLLSPERFNQIIHQLDLKCRDVMPLAYKVG